MTKTPDMIKTDNIKICPNCGGKPYLQTSLFEGHWQVHCTDCLKHTPWVWWKWLAVWKWNRLKKDESANLPVW